MSLHTLNTLMDVFDIYASPAFKHDPAYSKSEYYVTASDKEWTIEIPLPGMNKENLKVDIEDTLLTIQANTTIKSKAVRNFKCSWHIDEAVDVTGITAKLENGLLLVTLPRIKPTKKNIAVNIS